MSEDVRSRIPDPSDLSDPSGPPAPASDLSMARVLPGSDAEALRAAEAAETQLCLAGMKRRLSQHERRTLTASSLLLDRPGESAAVRTPNTRNPRLCIYLRLSNATAASVSMNRQLRECRSKVKRLGGSVDLQSDVFGDYDISAAGGKLRLGMEAALRLVRAGHYDGMVMFDLSRGLRNKVESFKFKEIMQRAGCELYVVSMEQITLFGPMQALFDAVVDVSSAEVEAQRSRSLSFHRYMAGYGVVKSPAPFGMRPVWSPTLIPGRSAPHKVFAPDREPRSEFGGRSPAEMVQSLAAQVLTGRSLASVAREWNDAGYPLLRGTQGWSAGRLRILLSSPSLAGVAHHRRVLLDVNREPVPEGRELEVELAWVNEPLLELTDWVELNRMLTARGLAGRGFLANRAAWVREQALAAQLGDAEAAPLDGATIRQGVRRTTKDSVLAGLVRCARCEYPVLKGGTSYYCSKTLFMTGGCGGNSMSTKFIEPLVIDAFLDLMSTPDLQIAAEEANAPLRRERIGELEVRLSEFSDKLTRLERMWLDTKVQDADATRRFAEHRQSVELDVAKVKAELTSLHEQRATRVCSVLEESQDPRAEWESMSTQMRNSALREMIAKVQLHPVKQWARRTDPTRVEIIWS